MFIRSIRRSIGFWVFLAAATRADAAQMTILHSFAAADSETFANEDGRAPSAGLVKGPDGAFYGSTIEGGPNGTGTIFRLTPAGDLTTLHVFGALDEAGQNADGAAPFESLVPGADGNLYGVARDGGPEGSGAAFRISPAGTFTLLGAFGTCSKPGQVLGGVGISPQALAKGGDGNFYGTTLHGGTLCAGSVFRMAPDGSRTTLYSFTAPVCDAGPCVNSDGALPEAPVVEGRDGNWYGTTYTGGAYGQGTIFRLTAQGVVTTLHSFGPVTVNPDGGWQSNADGVNPGTLIESADGVFFGTAYSGGPAGGGTVFRVTSDGDFQLIHNGHQPIAALTRGSDGDFYGIGSGWYEDALFRVSPAGEFTELNIDPVDGEPPAFATGTLLEEDGKFYGSSRAGGQNGSGSLFVLDFSPPGTGGTGGGNEPQAEGPSDTGGAIDPLALLAALAALRLRRRSALSTPTLVQ